MKTMEMAKKAFESRHAADAWFKDATPNFEAFAEIVRKEEREACARICESQTVDAECPERAQYCADAIRARP